MAQNWRNWANYYVIPYIGERDVREIDGGVCDALYGKLLGEGRIKAKPKTAHAARSGLSASYRASRNARAAIDSSPCGYSKRPRECGAASWQA